MDQFCKGFLVTQAPALAEDHVRQLLKEIYGITEVEITQLTGYDDLNFKLEECKFDERNEVLCKRGETKFILKFTNPMEARYPEFLVSLPFRLLSFLPGRMLEQVGYSTEIFSLVGKFCAKFHKLTDGYEDPGIRTKKTFFSLENLDDIEKEFYLLVENGQFPDKDRVELCEKAFRDVREKVFDKREEFEQGLIHSDMNETNLLLEYNEKTKEHEVVGLLDFGDIHCSFRIFDVANAILYLLLDVKAEKYDEEFFQIGNYVIQGYRQVRDLSEKELHILSVCMRARMAFSLIYGIRTAYVNYRNVNAEYILKTQSNGWEVLKLLTETNFESMNLSYH